MRNFTVALFLMIPLAGMSASKPISLSTLTPEQEALVQELLQAYRHVGLCAETYYMSLNSALLPSMSDDQKKDVFISITNNRLTCEKPAFEELEKIQRRAKSVGL